MPVKSLWGPSPSLKHRRTVRCCRRSRDSRPTKAFESLWLLEPKHHKSTKESVPGAGQVLQSLVMPWTLWVPKCVTKRTFWVIGSADSLLSAPLPTKCYKVQYGDSRPRRGRPLFDSRGFLECV